jgi:transposase-like protein
MGDIVEQDHRAIKRRARPMLGFKNFRCERIIVCGIETMLQTESRFDHLLCKPNDINTIAEF